MYIRRSSIWSDPRVKPPFGAAEIDWAHPLSQGLILATLFNLGAGTGQGGVFGPPFLGGRRYRDGAGPSAETNSPNIMMWVQSSRGIAIRCLDTSAVATVQYGNESAIPIPTNGHMTVLLSYRKTDATARGSTAWGVTTAVEAERCSAHLPYSDGILHFDYGGFTEGTSRLSVSGLTYHDKFSVWGFSVGPRGMEVWRDGQLLGSNGGTPTRTGTSNQFVLFGGTTASDLAESDHLYIYNRQLERTLIQQYCAEPYAMLRPVIRRRFFISTAAVQKIPQFARRFR